MQGDQWKSELARLLSLEQKRSSAARVKQSVAKLTAGPVAATAQSRAAIPAVASARVAAPSSAASASKSSSGGASVAKTLIRLAAPTPEAAFGLGSVVSSIVSLFSQSNQSTAAGPTVFSMPSPVAYQGAIHGAGSTASEVRYNGSGAPQSVGGRGGSSGPITVTVNAIDSKSFLDHSDAIASAVQKAMLESHSLNSVVMDL